MKESKFVKTKIFAGYAILIAVCVLSVGYVYRTVVRFSTPDGSYSLLHTKRSVAGQTLYHLYQAESYGQLMIAGYQSYESRYKRELRTVRGLIDSLRGLTAAEDSLQTMRLDSIVRLLSDKERRTMSLRRTIRSAATSSLLDKNIRELIGPRGCAGYGDRPAAQAQVLPPLRRPVQPAEGGGRDDHFPPRTGRGFAACAGGEGYDRGGAADAAGPGDQRPHRHLRSGVERRNAPAVQQRAGEHEDIPPYHGFRSRGYGFPDEPLRADGGHPPPATSARSCTCTT